ncbi:MAG: RhuM family protein [Akkermansia sp.]
MMHDASSNDEVIIYQTEDGLTKVDVRFEQETVWLSIDQMAELFQKSRATINEHILNIFKEGELQKDFSTKPTNFYNLDVVISVGYRVKSKQGTQFRIWATDRIKEYLVKGFTMDDNRLKQLGGVAILFYSLNAWDNVSTRLLPAACCMAVKPPQKTI